MQDVTNCVPGNAVEEDEVVVTLFYVDPTAVRKKSKLLYYIIIEAKYCVIQVFKSFAFDRVLICCRCRVLCYSKLQCYLQHAYTKCNSSAVVYSESGQKFEPVFCLTL